MDSRLHDRHYPVHIVFPHCKFYHLLKYIMALTIQRPLNIIAVGKTWQKKKIKD